MDGDKRHPRIADALDDAAVARIRVDHALAGGDGKVMPMPPLAEKKDVAGSGRGRID